jgi:acylphosphatase
MVRKRVLISGQVQGVFFRDSCQRAAARYDVNGWVRNLPDGRVEAVFEGAEDPVDRLVEWARSGPRQATVTGVEVSDEQPEGLTAFTVRD